MIHKRSLYWVAALLLIGFAIYTLIPNPSRYLWLLAFIALHVGMHSMHGHGGGHNHGRSHSSAEPQTANTVPEQHTYDTMPDAPTLEAKRRSSQ